MTDLIIFGGTTEGRQLAEQAAREQVRSLVSVVSEYGRELLPRSPWVETHCGALDEGEMVALISRHRPKAVLDATHPYASVVTAQLRRACAAAGTKYIRVVREEAGMAPAAGSGAAGAEPAGAADSGGSVRTVADVKAAVELLAGDGRPVLLTTGSKELEQFALAPHLAGRIFARVLPDSRVLAHCEALGIRGRRLIAMQGPFSREMNRALLHATGAGWLVTKESGDRGGFADKLEAAMDCGVRVIVIGRPERAAREDGVGVAEAMRLIAGMAPAARTQTLSLIGMGMGGGRQMTVEGLEALKESDAVLGAPRMLADVAEWTVGKPTEPAYLGEAIWDWAAQHPQYRRVAVVYSGDTGFYSGCGGLAGRTCKGRPDLQVRVFPGIPTVAALCAQFQVPWDHMYLASAHGRECDVAALMREHRQVFLLLDGANTAAAACRRLTKAGMGLVRVLAGFRLGYPDQTLWEGTADAYDGPEGEALAAVILLREDPEEETGEKTEKEEGSMQG